MNHYKRGYEVIQKENEALREEVAQNNKTINIVSALSGSKDEIIKSLLEENEQLKRSLENNGKKAGSIVGESTQTLNKVSDNDDDNIFEITM